MTRTQRDAQAARRLGPTTARASLLVVRRAVLSRYSVRQDLVHPFAKEVDPGE